MDTTPNFGLALPAANKRNWTDNANNNFKLIDALVATFVAVRNLKGVWENNTTYILGDNVVDEISGVVWTNQFEHTTSSAPATFAEERTNNPTYWASLSVAANNKGAWASGVQYNLNDFVVHASKYAVCIQAHVSSSDFNVDTAAGKWSILVDLSAAGSLVLPILAGVADANKFVTTNAVGTAYIVQTMAAALGAGGATSIGLTLLQIASAAAACTAINAVSAAGSTAFGLSLLTVADLPTLTASVGGMPPGAVAPFAGSTVPSGWLACSGQAVSRTTYAALFAAISTTYGIGDGTTTFNVPDLGGRVVAGKEAIATRLTSGVSGVDGGTLAAVGGDQRMQAHTHQYTAVQNTGSGADLGAAGTWNGSTSNTSTTGLANSQNVQPTMVMNYIIKT